MQCLSNEGIHFKAVHIDRSFPADHSPSRKPGTGMLTEYLNNDQYNIAESLCDRGQNNGRTTGKKFRL